MASDRFARRRRPNRGIHQRELSRITCEWGREVRSHAVVMAVFGREYKVLGMLGYSTGQELLWYGEPPHFVGRRGLRFKAPFQEGGPQPVSETDPELFRDTYICDTWGLVDGALQMMFAKQERPLPVNIVDQVFQGRSISDVVFEPTLHRVRALVLRKGLFRVETRPVMAIPPLAGNLRPAIPDQTAQVRWPWVREARVKGGAPRRR